METGGPDTPTGTGVVRRGLPFGDFVKIKNWKRARLPISRHPTLIARNPAAKNATSAASCTPGHRPVNIGGHEGNGQRTLART